MLERYDTFARANVASGWGTATDGNTYTQLAGTVTLSVSGNQGVMASSTASAYEALGAAVTIADGEGLVRFTPGTVSGSTIDAGGIILRADATAANYWLGRIAGVTTQPTLFITKRVSSTITNVATQNISLTAGTSYWIRFRCEGDTKMVKFWQAGTAEPVSWNLTATDVAVQGANNVGIYGFGNSTPGSKFDNFQVSDLTGSGAIWNANPGRTWALYFKPALLRQTQILAQVGQQAQSAALAGTSASVASATATVYQPGLVVTTETQSGISGGPPGNNSTQTTVTWQDLNGNGWAVGMVPAYGGALIAPWYELDSGVRSTTETSLSTSNPDGFIHLLANVGGVFTGTEDSTYTLTELAPTGQAFRRYYDSGTVSPSTGPALNYRVRTAIYPGDPGHYYHRIDITNPSASAVTLAGTDGLEIAMLGGLTQVNQPSSSAWIPGNGLYATVGGTETAWPGPEPTTTVADPDYVYITPTGGSGLKLAAVCIRANTSNGGKSIAALTGASNAQVTYLTNANRLKVKVRVDMSSFPGSTTMTLYYVESRPRNLAAGQPSSIAADYLNPDTASIVAVGTAASPFFSLDEGAYVVAASGNTVKLTHTFPTNVTKRWTLNYKVTGYTNAANPIVTVAGNQLDNQTALTYVDTGNQIAYVVLMPALVASGAIAPDLNNGQVVIQQPTGVLSGASSSVGGASATLSVAAALSGSSVGPATASATVAIAEALSGTATGSANVRATVLEAIALAGSASSTGSVQSTLVEAVVLGGVSAGAAVAIANLQALSGTQISGVAVALSTASATLLEGRALTTSTAGLAYATGVLTLSTAGALSGTAGGRAQMAATLSLAVALALVGQVAMLSTATGNLLIGAPGGPVGEPTSVTPQSGRTQASSVGRAEASSGGRAEAT